MKQYFETNALPVWSEEDILFREYCVTAISLRIKELLSGINSAWKFKRIEAPILIALDRISSAYDENDIFVLKSEMAGKQWSLRPETTMTSYVVAKDELKKSKMPLCVWQSGKSFRREKSDGATASKLRFNEFYQLEFQCIYDANTKADYRKIIENPLLELLESLVNSKGRMIESDRLPSYSLLTNDIEIWNEEKNRYFEAASISTRNDFQEKTLVLEIAIGLDRLIKLRNGDF